MDEFAINLRPPVQPGRREHDGGPGTLTRAVIVRFTDVAHDRQPRTPIRAHHQLVIEKKQKLGEWLRQSTRATDPNICATTEDFRSYFKEIFKGWSSDGHHPSGPRSLDCSASQTRIIVGRLKENAPLSKVQALTAHLAHNLARIAGEFLFCGVHFNNEVDGVVSTCRPERLWGPYDMISFPPGVKRADIRYQTIVAYDRHDMQRVNHHNSGIIVAWPRRAIRARARRGSQDDPDIDV
ncbi:hypothetical protein NW768_006536 [Fusarium equiseti]|uniref:Uncharacterized protein n=1 Tax=Fusarium equiseti TaxID=61235 RepID=A0ABQ8RBR2_FUSEQ|nr:hypothetical protein NW768_006536 [Fusarium equiseti]